jgi:predicted nucleic acid-binding protein
VIGGRVLDTSALLAFAHGTSSYASAAVWTAVEESIVLIVPSTAVAAAWTDLAEEYHPVLEVLPQLPVTVIDALDERRARTVGQLGGPQTDAHAIVCAQERG